MATAELTVLGIGGGDPSASAYVAAIHRHLAEQDEVGFELGPMGTALEGEVSDILRLVGELHAIPFEMGLPRVYSVLKLDQHRDREQTLGEKVDSVRKRLEG